MAGPLPRYDELGIRIAPAPGYNPAGAQAAAGVGQALAQNVDRLVGFAFRQAEEQARQAGLEYGAANAPTPEQIRKAAEAGTDIDIGSTSTVFGQAQRKASLEIATQSMQTDALQKMAVLRATALKNNMPGEQFSGELQSLINGYGASMERLSPASAASLRAALSTTANSTYLAYLEKEQQRQQAQLKIQAAGMADALISHVDDDIAAGNRVDPKTGTVTTVDQLIALKRVQILKAAAATNDPEFASAKLRQLQEAVDKAKVSTVAAWTIDKSKGTPSPERYRAVMLGDFGADDPSKPQEERLANATARSLWATMSPEQRVKAQDEVRRQMSAAFSLDATMDAARERDRQKTQSATRIEFRKAWMQGDTAKAEGALRRMEEIGDSEGFEKHAPLVGQRYDFTEGGVLVEVERDILNGRLTEDRVMELVKQRRLSESDARATLSKLDTVRDRRFSDAMTFVKGELGYPDKGIIRIGNDADRKAEQQVAAVQNALLEARRVNPDANLYDLARQEVTKIKTAGPGPEAIDGARKQVEALAKLLGVPPETPPGTLRSALAVEVAKGARGKFSNANTAAAYRQALDLLDKVGGPKP